MDKTYSFKFGELGITASDIGILLGFGAGEAPEPFAQYIEEVLELASDLQNICGYYRVFNDVTFNLLENTVAIQGKVFNTGKIVTGQLKKADSAALFVCTAGTELEIFSKTQMKAGNMPEGFIADLAGSVTVEKAMDLIQADLASEMQAIGKGISNRYSPGYCNWNVEEQKKLFPLLPDGICNISLNGSSLMHPVKSISGIIGIGKGLRRKPYTCHLCTSVNCIFKSRKQVH